MSRIDPRKLLLRLRVLAVIKAHTRRRRYVEAPHLWRRQVLPN